MFKKYMKKAIALVLATSMLAVCGCGQQAEKPSEKESTPVTSESKSEEKTSESKASEAVEEERVTLTVFATERYVEDYETNYYTKMLEEKANVDLEFITVPRDDFPQKLSLMINGGEELPDVIAHYGVNKVEYEYGSAGFFLPLNEYFEDPEATPNFHKFVTAKDQEYMLKFVKTADGNIYAAPSYRPSVMTNFYNNRAWINVEWLEAIGKEMPTTTEDFYEVLKAFKEMDPNGNGKADEIPAVSATQGRFGFYYLLSPFGYVSNAGQNYMNVDADGKVYPAFTTEEWKEGLTYINKLVSEDLYTPLSFTQDNNAFRAMVRDADVQKVGVYFSGSYDSLEGAGMNSFEPLPPLTGPNGDCFVNFGDVAADGRFVITKDCDNIEAAVRLMDALYDSEITAISRLGEPEVDWTTNVPDGYVRMDGKEEKPGYILINNIWGTVNNKHWTCYTVTYENQDDPLCADGLGISADDPTSLRSLQEAKAMSLLKEKGTWQENRIVKLLHDPADITEFTDLQTAIKTYVDESMTRFSTGDLPLSQWDEYIKTLEGMGLDRFVELTQKGYENFNK